MSISLHTQLQSVRHDTPSPVNVLRRASETYRKHMSNGNGQTNSLLRSLPATNPTNNPKSIDCVQNTLHKPRTRSPKCLSYKQQLRNASYTTTNPTLSPGGNSSSIKLPLTCQPIPYKKKQNAISNLPPTSSNKPSRVRKKKG